MNPRSLLGTTALMILAAAAIAGCAGSSSGPPSMAPSATPVPTLAPGSASPTMASAAPGEVDLTNATGNDLRIEIADASGTLVGAASGTPGDGASVEPYSVLVTNDDPTTLRLTWVGGPCDALDSLAIDATGRRFLLVEPECPGDSMVFDRELVLRFAGPVAAGEIEATLQDGLDTDGR